MKTRCIFILFAFFLMINNIVAQKKGNLYNFKLIDNNGEVFNMNSLKGKKVILVNVASKCGLTPQYTDLQKLYTEFRDSGLVIIGFPANNFNQQEPGTNAEIKEFCTKNYGVTFPIMSKISVKGDDIAPLYKWLTQKEENGFLEAPVKWNFQKFLINENGELIDVIEPKEKPNCEKIINWLRCKTKLY